MVTLRLPAVLRDAGLPAELTVDATVATIGDLLAALEPSHPGLARALDEPIYNFAVNDAMVLHGARAHPLADGDVVEVVPTIAGG